MSYETATKSGVTNAAGEFQYVAGEAVTFSVGDTQIGDPALAAAVVTPEDLVPGLVLYTTSAQLQAALRDRESAETQAFIRFVNILVFLQSIDEDADPSNGISIPAGIDALLAGVQIDFDTSPDRAPAFRRDSGLGDLLEQAFTDGLLSTAQLVDHARAMDHYYGSQGINVTALRLATVEEDDGANDTIDRLRRFSYDGAGNFIEEAIDEGNDGSIQRSFTTSYDDSGNAVGIAEFIDGALVSSEAYVLDVNGCPIRTEHDLDGDTILDRITTRTVELNCRVVRIDIDLGANDTIDRTVTRIWADDHHMTQELDSDNDGSVDSITTLERTFGENGIVIEEFVEDDGADGLNLIVYRETFNAQDDRLELWLDTDNDGTAEATITNTFTFDAEGFLVEEIETVFNPDGIPDFGGNEGIRRHTYDVDGILESTTFLTLDETVQSVATYTYESGNWVSVLNGP